MRIKNLKILLFISIISIVSILVAACDTGECFDNSTHQSKTINKATPSSKPISDTDC